MQNSFFLASHVAIIRNNGQFRRAWGNPGFLEANSEVPLGPADVKTWEPSSGARGTTLAFVFSVNGGHVGVHWVAYRSGNMFFLQKQNNYKTIFLCGEKVLLRISAYLGTGNQARFTRESFTTLALCTHLISQSAFQKPRWAHFITRVSSGDRWRHALRSFLLLTFIDLGLWNVLRLQPQNQTPICVNVEVRFWVGESCTSALSCFFPQHKKFKSVTLWGIQHCCCQNKCCIIPFQDYLLNWHFTLFLPLSEMIKECDMKTQIIHDTMKYTFIDLSY